MSNLILPRREIWTRQPRGRAGIARGSQLSENLAAAFAFSTPGVLFDAVSGRLAENKGVTWAQGPNGIGITASTAGIRIPWSLGFVSEDISITVVEHRAAVPSGYWMLCDNRESGAGYVYGAGTTFITPSGELTAPGWKVTTVCKSEYYQNGIKTSAAIGTGLVPSPGVRFFGRYTDSDPYNNSVIYALLVHRRNISQQEHNEIYRRPWQIFAPRTTYLFSVTALANIISLGLVSAQFSAQAYQASADRALGAGSVGAGAYAVASAGVLSTAVGTVPVTSQAAFVSAVQSLQSTSVSLNSPDLDYILGALDNAVSLGLASISSTARAITYSTPGGTVHVVPYEFLGDYDIVHFSGSIAVDRAGALIIVLR